MPSNQAFDMSSSNAERGRLLARPIQAGTSSKPTYGLQTLDGDAGPLGLVYVPSTYMPTRPAPVAVLLHGAGGTSQQGIGLAQAYADALGIVLLAPASRWRTWDMLASDFGPDVARIDHMLTEIFGRYAIDPTRLALGGFSDGASYALSLGLANGDLFSHILAFSPGFNAPPGQAGAPRIFISHGVRDTVLPIDRCSRRIVPRLQEAGYKVIYEEFDGPHTVPPAIARQALDWFSADASSAP